MPNWRDVLNEVQRDAALHTQAARASVDFVRRKYLTELHAFTGRNVIAYYSGWLSKPGILESEINDEDKNGFMMAVHHLDRTKGLDLILHTPGGSLAATESIVDYLHRMFKKDIRAIVPQLAMSAGTMMACSCKSIVLATHSSLGPTDPHLNGIPATGVIREFKRAVKEVKADPAKIAIWREIISQYRPTFLSQCENAVTWANEFVQRQLETVMFSGDSAAPAKARRIVKALTDYTANKSHSRHLNRDECIAMGLKVEELEKKPELQDLVLTVHHSYMHTLMNTNSFKMIENHTGAALVKQQQVQAIAVQQA